MPFRPRGIEGGRRERESRRESSPISKLVEQIYRDIIRESSERNGRTAFEMLMEDDEVQAMRETRRHTEGRHEWLNLLPLLGERLNDLLHRNILSPREAASMEELLQNKSHGEDNFWTVAILHAFKELERIHRALDEDAD